MPVTEIYILVPHLCALRALVREIIPNTVHTHLPSHPQTYVLYMTEIGFASIVRLWLRAFGAQHPSERGMACLT